MVGAFQAFYGELRGASAGARLTMHQIVTLASIVGRVEKGRRAAGDRRRVLNRLKKRMRLEATPRSIHHPDGPRRLTYRDLHPLTGTTRTGARVPPGPVNNPEGCPARRSTRAAQYLFFVADGFGGHVFTKTFSEHTKAVRDFRKLRRLRSSPPPSEPLAVVR